MSEKSFALPDESMKKEMEGTDPATPSPLNKDTGEADKNHLPVPNTYGPDGLSSTAPSSTISLDEEKDQHRFKKASTEAVEHELHDQSGGKQDGIDANGASLAQVVSSEYPPFAKLLIILAAVALSVFLVALDMVWPINSVLPL